LANAATSIYAYDECKPGALGGNTVDITCNNTFLVWWPPNGSLPPNVSVGFECSGEDISLSQYQQQGYEKGSTVAAAPSAETILGWGRELLRMPLPPQ